MVYLGKDLLYISVIFSVFVGLVYWILFLTACSVSSTSDWPVNGFYIGAS